MKKVTLFSVLTLFMAVVISSPSIAQVKMDYKKPASVEDAAKHKDGKHKQSTAALKADMHKLWEEHVVWTRNVIFCLVDELPGEGQAVKRLLQNQTDIGNAIKPYYGEEAGKQLTELLVPHITIATEVVKAAKAGDTTALGLANKRWYANADEISVFLSKANPNWALADMKMMMHDHLKLTTDEAVQRIKKDYDADVIAYGKVHEAILMMSDMLTAGIVKQFPEKFTSVNQFTTGK